MTLAWVADRSCMGAATHVASLLSVATKQGGIVEKLCSAPPYGQAVRCGPIVRAASAAEGPSILPLGDWINLLPPCMAHDEPKRPVQTTDNFSGSRPSPPRGSAVNETSCPLNRNRLTPSSLDQATSHTNVSEAASGLRPMANSSGYGLGPMPLHPTKSGLPAGLERQHPGRSFPRQSRSSEKPHP